MGEREIGRETGEKEKKLQTQKNHAILSCRRTEWSTTSVVLQSTVVFQSGYQRQGGKENDRKRDGLGERERKI